MVDLNKRETAEPSCEEGSTKSLETELTRLRQVTETYPLLYREIVWKNVVLLTSLHILGFYGLTVLMNKVMWKTVFFVFVMIQASGAGVTVGSHRLWCHRSFKARLPFRIVLMMLQSQAYVTPIVTWVRDHRTHHKYSDTVADPHNASHGFFYSHVGWLFVRKHPEVTAKGKMIDLSDIYNDPVVMFQKRHYLKLVVLMWALQTAIPLLWGEDLFYSFIINFFRFCYVVHCIWAVNSAAHLWGMKDYDKNIKPANNVWVVAPGLSGEGYHNYHHTFPYDYQMNEFSTGINFPAHIIKFMSYIGQAYDLRQASPESIQARKEKTGIYS